MTYPFTEITLKCPKGHELRHERVNSQDKSTRAVQLRCPKCGKDYKFMITGDRVKRFVV